MKQDRYFIVFYTGTDCLDNIIVGYITGVVPNGGYINNNSACNSIIKDRSAENVVITNIIELSEADYIEYTRKS